MGLDMYLYAKKFVAGTTWEQGENGGYKAVTVPEFQTVLDAAGLTLADVRADLPSVTLDFTVAYWRKANAIHNWFVNTCADGVDNCQPAWVSRDALEELRDTVAEVLETKDTALLPPQDGFFFGSTEIDEWYWKDLEETLDTLNSILSNPKFKDWDFEYQASW